MWLVCKAFQRSWPGLPLPTLPAPPPTSTASSFVLLQLCLALQGSCSGPAVHSHQRVCFCAGVRPGRTRVRALDCCCCCVLLSYFSRSPEVGKWALQRFLLGSLEPCRRIASLYQAVWSVSLAFLVALVFCRRLSNCAAVWLIGCSCVTGLSMKFCK